MQTGPVSSVLTNRQAGPTIAVIGAGVIGLTAALALHRRGGAVTVFERDEMPGRGASWAAAGMLAPAYEALGAAGVHKDLFEACLVSSRMWGRFAADLKVNPATIGYARQGALACARNRAEADALAALDAECRRKGVKSRSVSLSSARRLEPSLGDNLVAVLSLPSDRQVDNRALIGALLAAVARSGIRLRTGVDVAALGLDGAGGWQLSGSDMTADIRGQRFDFVLVSSGAGARRLQLEGNLGETRSGPRIFADGALCPVKGQMLAVPRTPRTPRRTLRFGRGYIAPKADRVVIGATVEPGDETTLVNDNDIRALWSDAVEVCPGLGDGPMLETWAGVRPGTPDHAPLVGPLGPPGLFAAVGHYRNGILLAPWTGQQIAAQMLDGTPAWLNINFDANRFSKGVCA